MTTDSYYHGCYSRDPFPVVARTNRCKARASIQPVAPLTIEPVGPLDPDWFEDDDTPYEDDHATTAQRHHLLSRYNNLEEAR